MKKRFTEEQIIGFLSEADAGVGVKELCRKYGFIARANAFFTVMPSAKEDRQLSEHSPLHPKK